jgi:hypothetical protein
MERVDEPVCTTEIVIERLVNIRIDKNDYLMKWRSLLSENILICRTLTCL